MAGWRGALLRHFTTARAALAEVPGAGYSAPQTQPYNQVPYNSAARIRELSGGYSFTPEPYPGEPVTERTEFLWKVFFKDPSEWWDNRNRKRVSTEPDFEKKGTKERLWLDDKTPAWVEGELEAWKKRKEEARRPTHGYGSHLYPSTATASEEGNSSESNASTSETPSDVDSTGCKEFKPEASPEAIKRVNKALDEIMVRIREKEKKAVEEKAAAADKPAEETDSTAEANASTEKKPGSLIRRYPRHNRKILEQEGEEGKLENSAEYHSEKLAIAYGLLKTPPGTTIRIFKNLRVCVDCHEFTKAVTRVTGREIIARDANRFHHFKDGKCSCNDYW